MVSRLPQLPNIPTPPRRLIRLARLVATAVIVGVGISQVYFAVRGWSQSDAGAYWNAALRLRAGEPLYPVVANVEASDVYRYAPWFAALAVPFTYLPVWLAGAIWSVILLAASAGSLVPLVRRRAWLLVALFVPILVQISAYGNVQPLLIAALVWGVERRSGPIWVGAAASLKITPILFALTYLGRGQWLRAIASVLVAALLWAPALFMDLRGYVTDTGQAGLFGSLPAYVAVTVVAVVIAFGSARTRWSWLVSSAAVVLGSPRFFIYELSYLQVATPEEDD